MSLLYPCTLLTACTLLTGSLWGYPTWGTYWIWDARLTSSFIMLLTLIALITIHQLPTPNRSKINRLFTIIAIIGWINIPFVHFSVEWFQTLHQGPSLSLLRPTTVEKPYLIMVIMAIFQMILWSMSSSLFLFYRHIRISYGLHR